MASVHEVLACSLIGSCRWPAGFRVVRVARIALGGVSMATILDVIDNFFTTNRVEDITTVPGSVLHEFGDEVRRFAGSYEPPALDQGLHPTYLGGWPSANIWDSLHGDLVMTTLLYSGQALAKDPIADWFAPEQYKYPRVMAARPGYLDHQTNQPNMVGTRAFLGRVVPALREMRPLIENGIVVLVPGHRFVFSHLEGVHELSRRLANQIAAEPAAFTNRFTPSDLAVEDNVRGAFVFAGGDREAQIRKVILHSLDYFAGEYLLAERYGASYTAVFPYEQHVCEEGLDHTLFGRASERVVRAVLTSPLPIFSGLTPIKLAEVRDDDHFGDFRGDLHRLYGSLPPDATELDIAEAEGSLLRPVVERLEKEAKRGRAGRMGLMWAGGIFRVGATLLPPGISTAVSAVGELLGVAGGRRSSARGSIAVWRKLVDHRRGIKSELDRVQDNDSRNLDGPEFWGIPTTPSMSVSVSSGLLLMDFLPDAQQRDRVGKGSKGDPYDDCPCGSGLRFKFCCKGLKP